MQTEEIIRTDEAEQTSEPCNPRNDQYRCSQEAAWCLTMICCGSKTFLCDEHNQLNNALVDLLYKLDSEANCGYCGVLFRGSEIYSAEIVTPLK